MREAVHTEQAAIETRRYGLFLAICVGLGAASGLLFRPDAWFEALQKPSVFPSEAQLAAIWLVFFASTSFVGARLFAATAPPRRWPVPMRLWLMQLLAAMVWPFALYGAHNVIFAASLAATGAVCALALSLSCWRSDRKSVSSVTLGALWFIILTIITIQIGVINFT